MKKVIITTLIVLTILLTGCSKTNEKEIRKEFIDKVESLKGYYLEGKLNLTNNDDNYEYDVEVSYSKEDKYKVVLTNNANNYRQIILKNNDGVYVVTPELNKSFKFQSEWPNNNSQSYLLDSVAKDLKNDESYTFTQKDNEFIFTTKVNYPNNKELDHQNITLDQNMNLKKTEVLNKDNVPLITFTVTSIDKKATFANNYFDLKTLTENIADDTNTSRNNENCKDDSCINETTDTNKEEKQTLKETVFPLYLPENTSLSNKEVIEMTNGERVIMTFSGDKPFILVQETANKEDELTIISTYGEPYLLVDTVGSLTDVSYSWTSNGIEYYIVSDVMDTKELLEVAASLNVVSTMSTK